MSDRHQRTRKQLDNLFLLDAGASIMLGAIALLSPHNMLRALSGGYNHSTHEALRLYGCLRIAVGWILFNVRAVDDGRFRKSICGTLCVCYALQSVSVLRDQLTNSSGHWCVWIFNIDVHVIEWSFPDMYSNSFIVLTFFLFYFQFPNTKYCMMVVFVFAFVFHMSHVKCGVLYK